MFTKGSQISYVCVLIEMSADGISNVACPKAQGNCSIVCRNKARLIEDTCAVNMKLNASVCLFIVCKAA